jgi:hypothetical protein
MIDFSLTDEQKALTWPQHPVDDVPRFVARAHLNTKPEVGIQFGAGGATTPAELEHEGTCDVVPTIARELGLGKVMFEGADLEVFGW